MTDKMPTKFSESPSGLPGGKKQVDAVGAEGNRGIPPKIDAPKNPSGTVHSPIDQGNKGIPPFQRGGEKKAPLD